MFTIQISVDGNTRMDTLYNPMLASSDGCVITAGSVDLELGKAGSATITVPKTNPLYGQIQKMKTLVQIMNGTEELFCGRVLHDEVDFYGNKELYLEGNLAFMIDRIMPFPDANAGYIYNGYAATYFRECMDIYNNQSPGYSTLEAFDMTNSYISSKYTNMALQFEEHEYVTIQDAVYDKIVNTCGGYLKTRLVRFDNGMPIHTIDYVDPDDVGTGVGQFHVSDQTIEFGENLLDLSEYITAEDTFTVLVPLGKMQETKVQYTEDGKQHEKTVNTQRIDISGVTRNPNVDPDDQGQLYVRDPNAQAIFGNIWKTIVWDDVSDATQLYGLAHDYLGQYNHINTTLTISAVDLSLIDVDASKFHVGDYVVVASLPHGFNKTVQCKKINIDLLNPGNSEYTFETPQKTISEMQSSTASNVDSVKAQMSAQGSGSIEGLENRITNLEAFVEILQKYSSIQETEETTIMGIFNSVDDWRVSHIYLSPAVTDRPANNNGILAVRKLPGNYGNLTYYTNDGYIWHTTVSAGVLAEPWKQIDFVAAQTS